MSREFQLATPKRTFFGIIYEYMATITTLIGGNRETRELTEGVWMIGRGEMCRIRLDFPDVSERHAILVVRDGRVFLEDLHSANGTFVNGHEVQTLQLIDGDRISVGRRTLVYRKG